MLGVGIDGRWPGLERGFDGILLVGYHAMDNTVDAVLAHTMSSRQLQWIKINGVEMGEMEIEAAVTGMLGVPAIFVSSDDKGVAEAKKFMPWVETVTTKIGLGWNAAISKHPLAAAEEIREGVKLAVARLGEMKTFKLKSPMTVEIRYKRLDEAQAAERGKQGWKRIDPYTVRKRVKSITEVF